MLFAFIKFDLILDACFSELIDCLDFILLVTVYEEIARVKCTFGSFCYDSFFTALLFCWLSWCNRGSLGCLSSLIWYSLGGSWGLWALHFSSLILAFHIFFLFIWVFFLIILTLLSITDCLFWLSAFTTSLVCSSNTCFVLIYAGMFIVSYAKYGFVLVWHLKIVVN